MRLLRFGPPGEEKPGVVDARGGVRDISPLIADLTPRCLAGVDIVREIESADIAALPAAGGDARVGPCIGMPGKIVCIGYNSKAHTRQMGRARGENGDLVVFLKPFSALCGPNDPILYSRYAKKLDWEAELGVVIGRKGRYIGEKEAAGYILGYTCFNDVSDRYWQFETDDTQFTKGKGFDSFAPVGPHIVTPDEAGDPSDLSVRLRVNGELRQDFSTSDYILGVEGVVSYLSRFFTLYPGDLIAMGSGPGNAKSWGEDTFLKPGDRVSLEIETLGRQEQLVEKES